MRFGPLEIELPDPPLRDPHAVVMVRPWINVGNVGAMVLGKLKNTFNGAEIGRLIRPGQFYDFTRYRPEMKLVEGERHVTVPNTVVLSARRPEPPDLVLVHILEPHANAEDFNEAIVDMLEAMNVSAYVSVGSMYDSVPHTRPIIVSGSTRGWEAEPNLGGVTLARSNYEGPTSITGQIPLMCLNRGMSTISLMTRLPLYVQLENDFAGCARVLDVLSPLYGLGDSSAERDLGRRQYEQITPAVLANPQLSELVLKLEREYDAKPQEEAHGEVELSPEIEKFLEELRRGTDNGGEEG